MQVNTGIYFEKLKSNVTEQRVAAGKQPMLSQNETLVASEEKSIDLSTIKLNDLDGIATGVLNNTGTQDIELEAKFSTGNGVEATPKIVIKPGETFDLGLFNGLIRNMTITNVSATDPASYSIIGV